MQELLRRTLLGCAVLLAPNAVAGAVFEPHLQLALEERYDDDLLLRTAGAGQLMTKVSPRLGLELRDPTLTSETWYAADLLMRHGSGRITLDHRGGLELQKGFSRRFMLRAEVEAWRVSDPSSLPRMGIARTLDPVLYGRGNLYTVARLSERLDWRLGYAIEGAKVYDAADRDPGFAHAPYTGLSYALSRRATVGSEYRYQIFQLGEERAQAHSVVGTFRYRITRLWLFDGAAGGVHFQPSAGSGTDGGLVPRLSMSLMRDGEQLDFAFAVGHDLVGASGFTSALWADHASMTAEWRLNRPLRVFGAASFFRNGRAPNQDWTVFEGASARVATGYALGAGAEWSFDETFALRATFDRYAQVAGASGIAAADLTRNIAAIRLVMTAF